MKHIFIPAMDELHRQELKTINNPEKYQFHTLLDQDRLVESETISFNRLLDELRTLLRDSQVPVDAIIAHWDFPTSVLVPILCEELGLPSPSLVSVLRCEHKLWSRLDQAEVVPEVVPEFAGFDPFADNPLDDIDLEFPFWVKPIKTFSSQLGFRVDNKADFDNALAHIRQDIGRLGDAFDEALARIEMPPHLKGRGGNTCLAEEIITGVQLAPEGSVCDGKIEVHGLFDMHRNDEGTKIDRMEYPSAAPQAVKEHILDVTKRLLSHIDFDNGCFNIEFMWDEKTDRLRLIEVNTRMSQSHTEMFIQVDGMSNHEIAIDVALGYKPGMKSGAGPYKVAARFTLTHETDGIVERVPSEKDIAALEKRYPYLRLKLKVEPGERLSELVNQDSYSFVLGELYLGANSHEELMERYQDCLAKLPFVILSEDNEAAS